MNLNLELLKLLPPIFNTLDGLIENYGVYLYLVFAWLTLVVTAWIFSDGLRRRMKENAVMVISCIIITRQSEPPFVDIKVEQVWNGGDESMD